MAALPCNRNNSNSGSRSNNDTNNTNTGLPSNLQLRPDQVLCQACCSINCIKPEKQHLEQMCGTCYRLLPYKPGNHQMTATDPQERRIKCPFCAAENILPPNSINNLFMCGHCRKTIKIPETSSNTGLLAGNGDGRTYGTTGNSSAESNKIHVRCGQCPAVNQISPEGAAADGVVHFRCGQCHAVNKVAVS